jgi:KUP system potassium uptake protein
VSGPPAVEGASARGTSGTEPTGHTPGAATGRAVVLAALGIVFGDIGTSPLYALQTVFSIDDGVVRPTPRTSTA